LKSYRHIPILALQPHLIFALELDLWYHNAKGVILLPTRRLG
jgi:hypothetical protein